MVFLFILVALTLLCAAVLLQIKRFKNKPKEIRSHFPVQSFSVVKYLDRMEKANLEILYNQEKTDKILILWWGLDGLRLNEDGSLEWISRKKKEPEIHLQTQQIQQTQNQALPQMISMQQCYTRPAYMVCSGGVGGRSGGGGGGGSSFFSLYPTYTDFICRLVDGTRPINL